MEKYFSQINKDKDGIILFNIYSENTIVSFGNDIKHPYAYEWQCEPPIELIENLISLLDCEVVITNNKIVSYTIKSDLNSIIES